MASIQELEQNLAKMQQLLEAAQNPVQQRTFQDIINNLSQQLEDLKAEQLSEKSATELIVQSGQAATKNQLKSQPNSEVKVQDGLENQEDENLPPKQNYAFQGLGVLYGKILKRYEDNDNYYNVILQEQTYDLIIINSRIKDFIRADYNPDKDRYLIVYPYLTHFPNKNTTPKLAFTIVAANDTPHLDLKVNEFKLFGLWQFIGVSKCPVISIHRNRKKDGSDRVALLKQRFDNEKLHKKITRANHVPLLWRDAPVKPFRFNPKLDKDKQGDRYFVQIKARFIVDKEVWGFKELLAEPTLDIPKFYKPIKAVPSN